MNVLITLRTRREKYSNVLQTHIVIVGRVWNMSFFPKLWYSITWPSAYCLRISEKKHQNAHLSHNYYMYLKNVIVFYSPWIVDFFHIVVSLGSIRNTLRISLSMLIYFLSEFYMYIPWATSFDHAIS